jgi:DNA-binding beta-propeller fold protein YncE
MFRALVSVIAFGLWMLVPEIAGQSPNAGAFTSPIATGRALDPVGESVDLGSMPIALIPTPDASKLVAVLGGWREQGIQIIDLPSMRVSQTLTQQAAFSGAAFAPDGRSLYVSGGHDDAIYCYAWSQNGAQLTKKITLGEKREAGPSSRYPAGLAVSKNGRYLYVAENEANTLAVVDDESGEVVQRFGTDRYPYAIAFSQVDDRVYVSAWDGRTVSVFYALPDGRLSYLGRIAVGRHPSALLLNHSGSRLFVALDSMDEIAVVDTKHRRVIRLIGDRAPGGPQEGSTPDGLALSGDETRLYVAEADNNAVAVIALSSSSADATSSGQDRVAGRIPTDWYPTALLEQKGQLLVLSGKGHGTHANPDGPIPARGLERPLGYALGELNGTLRVVPGSFSPMTLAQYSHRVSAANGWNHPVVLRRYPPFKHVIYIIKENRTYDQVLGDLKQGDGDPSLVFFGEDVAPNHRQLALRFGNFDRFFTNAEVSSQGHIWSTAAYVTNYGERVIPSIYSDRRADNDEDDVDAPANGFLWEAAIKKGISFRDYGEWVKSEGGFTQTRPGLEPDISRDYPVFSYDSRDQRRADVWISEFKEFLRNDNMPQLEIMHLPMDHTAGGLPGKCTPRACMADNDLALGRIVEALSHSARWADTVIFVVEDDAQAGPDHVDCHRAPFYAISAYNRPGVVHRFVNTTDVVAAIEDILRLSRLSQFDYFSRSLAPLFAPVPDLTPYNAVIPRQSLEEKNPQKSEAALISEKLDFSAPDRIQDSKFNDLLWMMLKGNQTKPEPQDKAPLHIFELDH